MASHHFLQGRTGAAASKCCSRVKRSPTMCRADVRPSPWLDILVHPLRGSQLLDHTRRALWLGTPFAIDCPLLKEAEAKLFAAGRAE